MNALMQDAPRGRAALAATFARAAAEKRAAFLPYFTAGYPTAAESIATMKGLAEAGVDGLEIGIPFSDPLADGPTIQAASQTALENGATVETALRAAAELRAAGHNLPLLLMSYLNPILAYGRERFIQAARDVGADGLIIPDLPPEEAAEFIAACEQAALALVFFLAPTSSATRIRLAAEHASGFIYVVSLTGTTGARESLPQYLHDFIARLRAECRQPLVLGFGISNAAQARELDGLLDGFIVGSAIIAAAGQSGNAASELARSFVQRGQSQ